MSFNRGWYGETVSSILGGTAAIASDCRWPVAMDIGMHIVDAPLLGRHEGGVLRDTATLLHCIMQAPCEEWTQLSTYMAVLGLCSVKPCAVPGLEASGKYQEHWVGIGFDVVHG